MRQSFKLNSIELNDLPIVDEEVQKEEARLIAVQKAREKVKQDLQHRYTNFRATQRNTQRYQSMSVDLPKKYQKVAQIRVKQQAIKKEYD